MEEKMKNKFLIYIPIVFLILFVGIFSLAELKKEIYGITLNYKSAKSLFGEQEFNAAEFKKANLITRSKMAVSLLKKNQLAGTDIKEIKFLLGENTGYFLSDSTPTYILNEGWKENKDTWQLVILPGKDKKVKEVVINMNCCDD
ncbi:MAG: hypothetical protein V4596_02690 [Bdellovibrionota bacterium]